MKKALQLLTLLLLLSLITNAQKDIQQNQKRLALVVGNKDYKHATALKNTVNDAQDIASALKSMGFETLLFSNLDYKKFLIAIDTFTRRASEYDVVLFYYSGHGMMYLGENYLVPVDAALRSNEQQIEVECINIKRITTNFNSGEGKTNIAIIDACRNKPFNRGWMEDKRSLGTDNPYRIGNIRATGSIVAQSANEGETSSDNIKGRNGLYTSSLLKFIKEPGLSINEVFQLTRRDVKEKSKGSQNPIESNELIGNFYFIEESPAVMTQTTGPKQKPTQIDSDDDGIVDAKDICPDEKGPISNNGCPLKNNTSKEEKASSPKIQSSHPSTKTQRNSSLPTQSIRLQEGTTIRLALKEEVNSKTAAVGDPVELEVDEDVVVDNIVVIRSGTPVRGEITNVTKAKIFGQQGKVDFIANYTKSVDDQNIRIRSIRKYEGDDNTLAAILISPILIKGKNAKIAKGTKFNGYIDNNYTIAITGN